MCKGQCNSHEYYLGCHSKVVHVAELIDVSPPPCGPLHANKWGTHSRLIIYAYKTFCFEIFSESILHFETIYFITAIWRRWEKCVKYIQIKHKYDYESFCWSCVCYRHELSPDELQELEREMERLLNLGYRWSHGYTQCLLQAMLYAYKIRYSWHYQAECVKCRNCKICWCSCCEIVMFFRSKTD